MGWERGGVHNNTILSESGINQRNSSLKSSGTKANKKEGYEVKLGGQDKKERSMCKQGGCVCWGGGVTWWGPVCLCPNLDRTRIQS